ncbi:hypothetical protein EXIGLDRAFT_746876 [Exidia glandulosa HHB12029]|uniref:Extracellular membrane protein CFEM domain-containing protein n=1 Tax=Exidia glandulosa HHB12029 TaxID=1314781 RepID=A0A165LK98_EXIGL|nr:hypothetical protein EXIGLDRAFT_746876 [Exidia glandulosa HHB12029]
MRFAHFAVTAPMIALVAGSTSSSSSSSSSTTTSTSSDNEACANSCAQQALLSSPASITAIDQCATLATDEIALGKCLCTAGSFISDTVTCMQSSCPATATELKSECSFFTGDGDGGPSSSPSSSASGSGTASPPKQGAGLLGSLFKDAQNAPSSAPSTDQDKDNGVRGQPAAAVALVCHKKCKWWN